MNISRSLLLGFPSLLLLAADLKHAAEARTRLELAAAYAAGEKRRKMQAAAPIAIGIVFLIGGIALSVASAGSASESGGYYVSFFGLTGVGLGILLRSRRPPQG